jgi:hypothetical protein
VLVVDEVSMLEAEFFDKMEKVARIVRDSHLPFGGIQIILCGDFLQVPHTHHRIRTTAHAPPHTYHRTRTTAQMMHARAALFSRPLGGGLRRAPSSHHRTAPPSCLPW